jgi:hypothetical protein
MDPAGTTRNIVIALYQKIGAGAEVEVARHTYVATVTSEYFNEPGLNGYIWTELCTGGFTYTDTVSGLNNRTYRLAVITHGRYSTLGQSLQQMLGIATTEQT